MNQTSVYTQIRETVDTYLPGTRIVLFGSQARGDYDSHSDYDLLIITKEKYSSEEKRNWRTQLSNHLIDKMNAPFDVLMGDEDEIAQKQALLGHIVRTAVREGIDL